MSADVNAPGRPRVGRPGRRAIETVAVALSFAFAVALAAIGLAPMAAAAHDPTSPPPGCALGIAGPALHPATSVREARDAAFVALATERLPVRLASELQLEGARVHEHTDERATGVVRGAWIAGVRVREGGRIDALVCGPERDVRGLGRRWGWPRGLGSRRACAVGVAGVDIDPAARRRSARSDAREMLARRQAVAVDHALVLHGGAHVARAHQVQSTAEARRRIDEAGDALTESAWLDRDGRGPLARPGVLYLELCLPGA